MTHDLFCGYRPDVAVDYGVWDKVSPCLCGLITKIRTDERSLYRVSKEGRERFNTAYQNGYSDGVAWAQGQKEGTKND